MSYINLLEGELSNSLIKSINNDLNWVNVITDDISQISSKNGSYIDTSNLNFGSSEEFISFLENLKQRLNSNYYVCIPIDIDTLKEYKLYNTLFINNKFNPVTAIYNQIKKDPSKFRERLDGIIFIFCFNDYECSHFIITANKVTKDYYKEYAKILDTIKAQQMHHKLLTGEKTNKEIKDTDLDPMKPVEKTSKELDDATNATMNDEILYDIDNAVKNSETEEEALDKLAGDERFISTLSAINNIENNHRGADINERRRQRMLKANNDFKDSTVKGRLVKDLLTDKDVEELPSTDLHINSVNEEWKDMKFINFNKEYDMDSDIVKVFYSFTNTSYPISILSCVAEDTSNKMDYVDTYTVSCEDAYGKRFKWVVDVPQLINYRFMKLRGNEKVISGQLTLLPCTKTEPTTVQIVSNYNKVFIRLTGPAGKSTNEVDIIVKTLNRLIEKKKTSIKVNKGDFSKICAKYKDLPTDYTDLASLYNTIEFNAFGSKFIIDFNQDRLREIFNCQSKNIPIGYRITSEGKKEPIFYSITESNEKMCSARILNILKDCKVFAEESELVSRTEKTMCSMASILNTNLPVIVILGYLHGLSQALKLANINWSIQTSKPRQGDIDFHNRNYIKIGKEYLVYESSYASNYLLNGLTRIPNLDGYSIDELENKSTWINILGDFRDRLLSDGLENFEDLFVDPITKEVCEDCGNATTFSGLLIEANSMLSMNNYNKHTDITVNRYRTSEIIPGYLYNVMSKAYAVYANGLRKGRKDPMTIKRSALIDALMQDPTESDLSTLNALLEIESANATGYKGLSGLNTDRAYGLDKRTYDDSMLNKIGLSTGFAANVGITRWSTIDMNITGKRGYIKPDTVDDICATKTFCMTEALTPFGTTRDDPFRSAMTFIQTSKHGMRTNAAAPLLITTGADEALPKMVSDKFAFKAKDNGTVVEYVENKYIVVSYKNGTSDYINLGEQIEKNSDGGMYILIKLIPKVKIGQKFKKDDILAYDKLSFSTIGGENENLSYNVGALVKVAFPNSDCGFEDSTVSSQWMCDAMASEIVIKKEITLSPFTNVYDIVKPGQEIQEGEPLILFQNSFSEKDANLLLKNITDEEMVSDLGRIRIKSHYTGWIQDVEIYRTREIETYSESLQKLIKEYDKRIGETKKIYKKYNIAGINRLDPDYAMPETGELKNVGDGVKINIYIKYLDKFSIGDKNVAQSAAKGVNKDIFPKGKEPKSEYRPDEPIHSVYAIGSFNARMITSVLNSAAINKGLIELDRQIKDILGIPWKTLEEIQFPEYEK